MTNKVAATRYARALFDVALKEGGDLAQIEEHLATVVGLFTQHPQLQKVLLNPAVPVPRKSAVVSDLVGRLDTTPVLAKLLILLAERDRLVLLPDLLAMYRDRVLDHRHIVRAEVTTATPLTTARAQEIERRLSDVTGRTVTMTSRVDPAIIGGVIARIGSTVYDASVTRQLQKIRKRLEAGG
jgi:F-type H+-transporting ATPase subunit delta